jgi:hypothetical protein
MIRNRARFHHARDRRWARGVRLASGIIASGAIALLCAGTASADSFNGVYDQALPATASAPADGAAIQAIPAIHASTTTSVTFSVRTPVHGLSIYVEVATKNIPGQDGTLAQDYNKDFFRLNESDADPDLYSGTPNAILWMDAPGTYYWQMHAISPKWINGVYDSDWLKSPVYTLTVTAPQPPAGTTPSPPSAATPSRLTLNDAHRYAVSMIRQRTHHNISQGTITCNAVNNWTRRCNLVWTFAGYSYHASGRFWNYVGGDGKTYSWYNFRGTRTSLTCAKRHRGSHGCTQPFHWH